MNRPLITSEVFKRCKFLNPLHLYIYQATNVPVHGFEYAFFVPKLLKCCA